MNSFDVIIPHSLPLSRSRAELEAISFAPDTIVIARALRQAFSDVNETVGCPQ